MVQKIVLIKDAQGEVIKSNRVEVANVKDLKNGESIIISGLDVNRIQFVKERMITQWRRPESDPNGEPVETEVPQYHFSFGQRSFTVTGEGLESDGKALHGTIKKTLKGGDRVKEVYLIANEWHPQMVDAENNLIFEDEEQTIPVLNKEVTNHSFLFSGIASAAQVAEEQDDELEYEAKRNKLNLANKAMLAELKED